MSICAVSALVAVPLGSRIPFPLPYITPFSCAQHSAVLAYLLILSASVKSRLVCAGVGLPAYR